MIEQLKPVHPEHSRADYADFTTVEDAVDYVAAGFPDPEFRTQAQIVALTDKVQDIVGQSLWFEGSSSVEDTIRNQSATCVGYAIAGSEALEQAGIKHNIAFVNGHSTIFTPYDQDDGSKIRLVDMLTPDLTQDISDKFVLYQHTAKDGDRGRSFGVLNTRHLKNASPAKNPWLEVKEYNDARLEPASNKRLIVTLFTPEDGREVVANYACFKRAAENEQYKLATDALLELDGVFPDIDIRGESPKLVLNIVKKLSRDGRIDEAREVTRSFYDSFIGNDTRLYEKRADCVQEIAKISKKPEFAKRALELYRNSLRTRKALKAPIVGKMAISQALVSELE